MMFVDHTVEEVAQESYTVTQFMTYTLILIVLSCVILVAGYFLGNAILEGKFKWKQILHINNNKR